MKTPNLTGPSGRLSSLFRQKTSSSIHGNTGPNRRNGKLSFLLKTIGIKVSYNTFLDGCFDYPPYRVVHLTKKGVDVG